MLKVSTIFSKSKILLLYKKQNTLKTNKNNIFNKKMKKILKKVLTDILYSGIVLLVLETGTKTSESE